MNTVDYRVSEPLGGEKKQCQDGKGDLKAFGVDLLFCHGLLAPLRGGFAASTR